MKFFTVLLFAVSFSAFSQQQFNDLKVKNLELINETPSSVVITDDNKKTRTSTVSASELEGLSGVTGNIQEQIDAKVNLEGDETISGVKTFSGKIVSTSNTGGNSPCPPHDQASIDSLVDAEASDCVFNTTTKNLNVFDGTIWKSAGGGLSKWEEGKVFNLDDVVVYDNAIYRCVSAHTSSLPFEEVKWELISGDTVLNGARVKNVVAEKVIQTANDSFKIETDTDNLFTNGDFQAQNVMLGWQKGPGAGVGIHTTAPFAGNQSLSLQFVGSDADFWRDITRPEYVGRMARITLYYKSSATWTTDIPQICTFIGSTSNISSCSIIKNTGGQWGLYQSPNFYWSDPKVGLIIKSNGKIDLVNEVLLGRARLELDKNEGFVANIEGDYHQEALTINASITPTSNLSTLSKTLVDKNADIFELGTFGVRLLRDAEVFVSIYSEGAVSGATYSQANIYLNGVKLDNGSAYRDTTGSSERGWRSSVTIKVKAGQFLTFNNSHITGGSGKIILYAKARSQVTVFPDETFSTDINPVYWKATACLSTEIGCYNTYSYASSTNTRALCGTRPTQLDTDMRLNGIQVFARAFNASSNCGNPAALKIITGSNADTIIYKDSTRVHTAFKDVITYGNQKYGWLEFPNKKEGSLLVDLALDIPAQSTSGNASLRYTDGTNQASGYLVVTASKTGVSAANVPARYPVKPIESGNNWAIVYSDGWVEQYVAGSSQSVSPGNNLTQSIDLLVPSSTTKGVCVPLRNSVGDQAIVPSLAYLISTSQVHVALRHAGAVAGSPTPAARCESYGASSVVKQYGANPAY